MISKEILKALKALVHKEFAKAMRCKILAKPAICEYCGKKPKYGMDLVGHHYNYSLPLDVIWLCKKCHGNVTYYITNKRLRKTSKR